MKKSLAFFLWASLLGAQTVADRYIVELAGEPAAGFMGPAAKGRRTAAADRRAQIRAEQAVVAAAMADIQAEVLASLDTVANALIVRIPEPEAWQLSGIPGVVRVQPDRELKLMLDRAVTLAGAPDTWRQIGGMDKAGLGAKIGIIDTGIDALHPAFQDPSLSVPEGFPKVNREEDLEFTNNKIIVARRYDGMTARDEFGHGTAVAMSAAGGQNQGPLATITGIAPKAWLGNYKVMAGRNVTIGTVLRALDDAIADGMDVVNISLGSPLGPRPSDSIEASAIERAFGAGVLVVLAAGNEGPDPGTIGGFAVSPSAISVGASSSDRAFGVAVQVDGGGTYFSVPGSGANSTEPIRAPLRDVAALDQNGLACQPLPEGSLKDRTALILRGDCFFEVKLNTAQQAGAVAAVIYTDAERPSPVGMDVGSATLPAAMISYADGVDLKARLAGNPELAGTVSFRRSPVAVSANRLAGFSAHGPNTDDGIKPDLVAVGAPVYMATQSWNRTGEMFNETGYITEEGTSFSAPQVAGAVALLKSARPGLSPLQYRSLLIDTATPFQLEGGRTAGVQSAGAGMLNLPAALQATAAAFPASVSFGVGGGTMDILREVTITNVSSAPDTFTLTVLQGSGSAAPVASANTVQLAPGASQSLTLRFTGNALAAGEYQGYLRVQGTQPAGETRIPYWHAVPSGVPARLTILESTPTASPGATLRRGIYFRVTDAEGVSIRGLQPEVTVESGDGEVTGISSIDDVYPGVYVVGLRLGPVSGRNAFRIRVGEVSGTVTIQGTTVPHP